jgi:hypothetical protein
MEMLHCVNTASLGNPYLLCAEENDACPSAQRTEKEEGGQGGASSQLAVAFTVAPANETTSERMRACGPSSNWLFFQH